jgi:hypothetical protein
LTPAALRWEADVSPVGILILVAVAVLIVCLVDDYRDCDEDAPDI